MIYHRIRKIILSGDGLSAKDNLFCIYIAIHNMVGWINFCQKYFYLHICDLPKLSMMMKNNIDIKILFTQQIRAHIISVVFNMHVFNELIIHLSRCNFCDYSQLLLYIYRYLL